MSKYKVVFVLFFIFLYTSAQQIETKEDSLLILFKKEEKKNPTYAIEVLNQYIEKIEKLDQKELLANAYENKAIFFSHITDYQNAIIFYKKAHIIYKTIENYNKTVKMLIGISSCYIETGNNEDALDNFYKAFLYTDKIDEKETKSALFRAIAVHYELQKLHFKALKYHKKALQILSNNHKDNIINNYNVGNVYYKLEKYDSAKIFLNKSINLLNHYKDKNRKPYVTLAEVAFKEKEYSKALNIHNENIRNFTKNNNKNDEIIEQLNIAKIYNKKNNQHQELQAYNRALKLSFDLNSFQWSSEINENLYDFYKNSKNDTIAFYYYKQYTVFKDSLTNQKQKKKVAELNLKFKTAEKEEEIKKLSLKNKYQKKVLNKTYIISILVGLLFLLLLYGLKLRLNKNNKLREKDLELFHQKIVFANKKLTTHSLNIIQKNKLLNEIRHDILDLFRNNPTTKLKNINTKLNHNLRLENEWKNFKLFFEEVNPNFYKKLQNDYPKLSANDLKLAALIRLDFSIKQTSEILNITSDSVKTSRYRLRKKLNLDETKEKNLSKFLKQL